jgi:hypothetical protein
MANSKLSAFFSLLLVFFSGAVVGVFGYRVYNITPVSSRGGATPERKQDPEVRRKQLIEEDTREIHLNPEQVTKLEKVYDGTLDKFNAWRQKMNAESQAIRDDQIAQIKSFLTPEQVVLYDKLRAKREAQREHRKGGPGGPPPGPPPGR